jgi:hypothetical protein
MNQLSADFEGEPSGRCSLIAARLIWTRRTRNIARAYRLLRGALKTCFHSLL